MAVVEDTTTTAPSTFTCLSWQSFQDYLATRFAGAPGRSEALLSTASEHEFFSPSPSGTSWWDESRADMVACKYNSSSDP